MNFNEDELKKIKNQTSGFFKGKVRSAISKTILAYEPKVQYAKSLPEPERNTEILVLVNRATEQRNRAVQNGANSYSHPEWAAAAAVESWLHELMGGDSQGIQNVETLIQELRDRA